MDISDIIEEARQEYLNSVIRHDRLLELEEQIKALQKERAELSMSGGEGGIIPEWRVKLDKWINAAIHDMTDKPRRNTSL